MCKNVGYFLTSYVAVLPSNNLRKLAPGRHLGLTAKQNLLSMN